MKTKGMLAVVLMSMVAMVGGCGSGVGLTGNGQLKGTWQDANGNILVIDGAGNVVQEKYCLTVLLSCDGKFHRVAAGIEGLIEPYKISVDQAGNLTISQHNWKLQDATGTIIYKSSGSGLLKSSTEMNFTWIDTSGTKVENFTATFTKTSD